MNKGKKVSVQQYITRREEIKVRLNEIVDLAESENKRAFTDTENDEIECLKREMNALDVRIACATRADMWKSPPVSLRLMRLCASISILEVPIRLSVSLQE